MDAPLRLYSHNDGVYNHTYGEVSGDPLITWVHTAYTEEVGLDTCTVCGVEIEDWSLWLCMDDGSETAHDDCVEIWANAYSKDGSITHA